MKRTAIGFLKDLKGKEKTLYEITSRMKPHEVAKAMEDYAAEVVKNLPVVAASAFVDKCATMAEYIDGEHYDEKYKSSWIAVIEYQELLKAAKEFDNEH